MAAGAQTLSPELEGFPWGSTLPAGLVAVVNDLHARQAEIVTLADLARYDTGTTAEDARAGFAPRMAASVARLGSVV